MTSHDHEPRIAVFLDYENLAIGARDTLGNPFDYSVVADALAERGRVITRRAYADWSYFDSDRRMLTRHQVELTDIPQRMGGQRKNAADIKLAIDAMELALDRSYISTFVICTGDSDLSPLVQKLRELDRRVIGVGVRQSTSNLLPPACDEFIFYDSLVAEPDDATGDERGTEPASVSLLIQTLAGLSGDATAVRASTLKRALLRKDPTFSEADLGFPNFGSLIRSLAADGLMSLSDGNDPEVSLAGSNAEQAAADALARALSDADGSLPLTGLKDAMRKFDPKFSERALGYRSFGAFVRAAEARGRLVVRGDGDDRTVRLGGSQRSRSRRS